MVKTIVLIFTALGVVYFLFYPFFKNKVNRKKVFKWFVIVYIVAVTAATISSYSSGKAEQPESFIAGVEIVKKDRTVLEKIGEFKSLEYEQKDLPAKTDNPAELKFMLIGDKGRILVESTVAKKNDGNWHLLQIKKGIQAAGN